MKWKKENVCCIPVTTVVHIPPPELIPIQSPDGKPALWERFEEIHMHNMAGRITGYPTSL